MSGLPAGLHLLLLLPDDTEHEVLRRAGQAGIALAGCRDCGIPTRVTTCPAVTAW
jgi:hypothetical protein